MRRPTGCLIAGVIAIATVVALPAVGSAAPSTSMTGVGAFIVGIDIAQGTYETSGPAVNGGRCTWETEERHAGVQVRTDGDSASSGPMYARVADTPQNPVVFVTGGCATWRLVS